mmetsp:Transcript_1211/g.2518  ORF Transcript_1211/g.2518 Transcript_1211/m.2518 type:complete len:136 (-) Transcript_1211:298-705(-)
MAPNLAIIAPRVGIVVDAFMLAMGIGGIVDAASEHTLHLGVAIYTVLWSLILMPLEMPFLCICVPGVKQMMLRDLRMKYWLVRAILYFLITVFMFRGNIWSIFAGTSLCGLGSLYILAQCQGLREPDDDETTPLI